MIEIGGLIEQETVGKTEKEKCGAQPIEETGGDEEREQAEDSPMDIHPLAWPWLHPGKSVVFEEELRFDPVARYPVMMEISVNLPGHEKPEGDAEEDEARDINWREGPKLESGQERLFARHQW